LGARAEVAVASATALPLRDGSMQLLVLSDGLVSWGLSPAQREEAVREARRALAPGGHALFMDYLNPRRHHELIDPVRAAFNIERIDYLGDRLWFITDSAFRALKGTPVYRAFAGSVSWARAMRTVSNQFGPRGSKHFCVVAQKIV
jgi:SAM-dependent methyltransferase